MKKHVRILSTKVLPPSLIEEAEQSGISITGIDFLDIHYCGDPAITSILKTSEAKLVFTSQHGVQGLLRLCKSNGISVEGLPCFCISGKTAQLARQAGFIVVGSADHSMALGQVILDSRVDEIIFYTGDIHREEWMDFLLEKNIIVHTFIVYRKTLLPHAIHQKYDAVLFFSPTQVDAFLENNKPELDMPIFCVGHVTGDHVSTYKFSNIIVSNSPSAEAVVNCAIGYFNQPAHEKRPSAVKST